MSDYKDAKVKIVVKRSSCDVYKEGDTIYMNGALIDQEQTKVPLCMTALSSIYPFIYAARKRVTVEQMGFSEMTFRCPDCDENVDFTLCPYGEVD